MKSQRNEHPNVLVVTPDVLRERMAGPAIRSWEIASALSGRTEVRLVSTQAASLSSDSFSVDFVNDTELRRQVTWADIVIFQGHILSSHPWIADEDVYLVADIYDPMHLESLEQGKELSPADRSYFVAETVEVLNSQIERADFMLCASEKQRDFWLGHLASLGRINMLTYDADPSLRSLIDVVPFGLQATPPERTRAAIKGVVPGINQDDQVILWGGGIYNWFDPCTLIRAVAILAPTHPNLKLFFLGVAHPNPLVPKMREATAAIELSAEFGLTGTHVFFNEEWVEYQDRANYLLDADIGVSTHFDHVETSLSFRTRILDYLWAGLPIVATSGDTFAEIITENQLGAVVPPENAEALAEALARTLYSEEHHEMKQRVSAFATFMTWEQVLQPLLQYCLEPKHAADFPGQQPSMRRLEIEHLKRVSTQMENSTSWKITRPLRLLTDKLRRRS